MSFKARVRTKNDIEYSYETAYWEQYEDLAELLEIDTILNPTDWCVDIEFLQEAIEKTNDEKLKEILKTWLELRPEGATEVYVDWF